LNIQQISNYSQEDRTNEGSRDMTGDILAVWSGLYTMWFQKPRLLLYFQILVSIS